MLIQATKNDCFAQIKSIQDSNYLIQYLCYIHILQLEIEDTFKAVEGKAEKLKKCKALQQLKTAVRWIKTLNKKCLPLSL